MNLVDSCGWLEYVAGGSHADFYAAAIEDVQSLVVPTICLYEVFKRLHQQANRGAALETVAVMRQGRVVPLSESLALQAATLAIDHKLPLADSIILATARAHDAEVWTQDAHFATISGVHYCDTSSE